MTDLKQLNEFKLTGEVFGEIRMINKGVHTFGNLFLREPNRQNKDGDDTEKPGYHSFLASDPNLIKRMMDELTRGDVVSVTAYVYTRIKNINGKRFYIPSFRLNDYKIISKASSYEDSFSLEEDEDPGDIKLAS